MAINRARSSITLRATGISALLLVAACGAAEHTTGPASTPSTPAADLSGQIAFVSTRDGGNGQIYFANINGSIITRLTNDSTQDSQPSWSPDGEKIVFTRGSDRSEIWVMNADGSGLGRLHVGGRAPSLSPDGSQIAFATDEPGIPSQIAVMNADGSNVRALTEHDIGGVGSHEDTSPAWSPDGSQIAFLRSFTNEWASSVILIVKADGSGERTLNYSTYGSGYVSAEGPPSWSPDGRRILFWSYWSKPALAITNSDGFGVATQIAASVRAWPTTPAAWSPDGDRIAFATGGILGDGGRHELYVMNADGSGAVRLPVGPDGDQPAWRPRH